MLVNKKNNLKTILFIQFVIKKRQNTFFFDTKNENCIIFRLKKFFLEKCRLNSYYPKKGYLKSSGVIKVSLIVLAETQRNKF